MPCSLATSSFRCSSTMPEWVPKRDRKVSRSQPRQPLGCRRCAADDERAAGPPNMKLVWSWIGYSPGSFANSLNGQFIDRKPLFYETTIRLFAAIHGQSRTPRAFDPNWRLQTWEKRRRRSFPRTRIHFLCYTRCLRDGPATRQRSDWAQIFQPCAHRLREGQSLACLGQAAFIYAAAPRSSGPNRCLY